MKYKLFNEQELRFETESETCEEKRVIKLHLNIF